MRLKRKLAKLEQGFGVESCPHCRGILPPRPGEVNGQESYNDDERRAIFQRIFARFFSRETMLTLLAGCQPELRREIADVYPLSSEEQQLTERASASTSFGTDAAPAGGYRP